MLKMRSNKYKTTRNTEKQKQFESLGKGENINHVCDKANKKKQLTFFYK